jgi:hypothetical protein
MSSNLCTPRIREIPASMSNGPQIAMARPDTSGPATASAASAPAASESRTTSAVSLALVGSTAPMSICGSPSPPSKRTAPVLIDVPPTSITAITWPIAARTYPRACLSFGV